MRTSTRLWLACIASLGVACGDSADGSGATGSASTSAGGAGQGGSAQSGGGGQDAASTSSGFSLECVSGNLCGDGLCCDVGDECIFGACLAECASQVRCGVDLSTCCGAGQVCLEGACATPGGPCLDWADCADGEFCEPTLGACLPQPGQLNGCEYKPPAGALTPVVEWSWTGSTIQPAHNQVINMPVVVDLEPDGTPDVVIVTSDNFSAAGAAYLRALDGKTGLEKWPTTAEVYLDANRIQPRGTPAAADIDGDSLIDIVSPKMGGGLIAFHGDGSKLWHSTDTDGVTPWNVGVESATIAIADLEADGSAEIVVGGVIFEADGSLRASGAGGVYAGANASVYGAVSIVADLDGAMPMEVVTGRRALRSNGTLYWDNGLVDGYPAMGDLDLDGTPEIVVVAQGTVRVQSPTTGAVLASLAMPAAGAGGPPTIANFDGDPQPEIASANGGAYAVFEYTATPTPTLSLKWSATTQDLSSNRTGSSVFDFQGDGAAEVVYADECYFRVYDGTDGSVLYQVESSSATIHEYPVVVDVDGDNNTEVVVAANDLNHQSGTTCPYGLAGNKHGVFVYGDAGDNWVRTRRVWNQHAYHITNIAADGSVPAPEAESWLPPQGLNNYRQSNQGAGVFNAPDLAVSLQASLATCPSAVTLKALVQNQGSLGVAAGIPVTFYVGAPPGTLVSETATTTALLPGQFEIVTATYTVQSGDGDLSFFVVVDGNALGMGLENECLEDNNDGFVSGVKCPGVD